MAGGRGEGEVLARVTVISCKAVGRVVRLRAGFGEVGTDFVFLVFHFGQSRETMGVAEIAFRSPVCVFPRANRSR